MSSVKLTILAAALASTLLGACLLTEVINEAPVPGIRVIHDASRYQEAPYQVGGLVAFDATKTVDDDREGMLASWSALSCVEGRTPARCVEIPGATLQGDLDDVFEVELTSHETIEVQLRVTDALGATRLAPDNFTIDVSNRDPVIDMQVTGYREGASGPFVLSRAIQLIPVPEDLALGLVDSDGDALGLDWQYLPPVGSNPEQRIFAPSDDGYLLVPDVAGQWSVVLVATDGFGGSDEIQKDFYVGVDGPPCLQGMDPQPVDDAYYLVASADGPRRFSVLSVLDALDPFPAAIDSDPVLGEASFRWLVQEPGSASFVEVPGYDAASYQIDPLDYNPGDSLAIRVEVSDRVQDATRVLPCALDDWSCQLDTGSGCFQRQSWGVQIQ